MSNELPLDEALQRRIQDAEDICDVDEPSVKLVLIRMADEDFAIPGEQVREVLAADTPVFFVPGMPDSMQGVINLRGDIESVILLHSLLQLDPGNCQHHGTLLITQGAGMRTAIRADELIDVCDVPQSAMEPPPEHLPEHLRPYVSAVLRRNERMLAVLDLNSLFKQYRQGSG